ncbi:hypothetical protein DFA_11580 [Cavenderia fasciculata]|uniref:Uncharacterized protein n=1 Tax=Cavenderia fasciculata TaxID=261658 RepID=F4QDM2_CACFS|nr:uncharacterized protein DFA_11580 [Cavenderia fasciculata]EGG13819.1 hypothetical protein DFA_11580 [Cavenderia fasciculata]|eukprot:XP_004350527.1 hypothetical protein DFA_11580 [Cavenderia fasciculata]
MNHKDCNDEEIIPVKYKSSREVGIKNTLDCTILVYVSSQEFANSIGIDGRITSDQQHSHHSQHSQQQQNKINKKVEFVPILPQDHLMFFMGDNEYAYIQVFSNDPYPRFLFNRVIRTGFTLSVLPLHLTAAKSAFKSNDPTALQSTTHHSSSSSFWNCIESWSRSSPIQISNPSIPIAFSFGVLTMYLVNKLVK